MSQFSLFAENTKHTNLLERDGHATYDARFFAPSESDRLFDILRAELAWRQDEITLYGKTHPIPRLQAWYGKSHTTYRYSSLVLKPLPWTATLLDIKRSVEAACGHPFNCVLANLYRHGRDYAAWHSDDEAELGVEPVIASVSFGATRKFRLEHKRDRGLERVDLELEHGSLLIMKGRTQDCWKHQLVKTAKPCGERINLTFRHIALL